MKVDAVVAASWKIFGQQVGGLGLRENPKILWQ